MPVHGPGDQIVTHKGIEYKIACITAGFWRWQFQIGDRVIAGTTEANLDLLAIRRVQARIDRELKKVNRADFGLGHSQTSPTRLHAP
jgi:hypothetical protein